MDEKFKAWVNIKITDKVLLEQLDAMCQEDSRSRSDFLRLLVKKEWQIRRVNVVATPVNRVINQNEVTVEAAVR
jgi:metal-responsive CopG/Arc/MetJ family transcriptional regulator